MGYIFHTNVQIGDSLFNLSKSVSMYGNRYILKYLRNYFEEDFGPRLCALYGLKKTGKSTMMLQMLQYLDLTKTAFIKLSIKDTMSDLIADVRELKGRGIQNILIDDITLVEDFISHAAMLSDIYCAMGIKIVITGDDSLEIEIARCDELYDRCVLLHTNYISYKEFCSVFGIYDKDEYIEYGGTMENEIMDCSNPDYDKDYLAFYSYKSTKEYIKTAICKNLQNSLKKQNYGVHWYVIKEIKEEDLEDAIISVIEKVSCELLNEVIEEKLNSSKDQINWKKIQEEINTIVCEMIHYCNQYSTIVENKIIYDLCALHTLAKVQVKNQKNLYEEKYIFLQPGMQFAIIKETIERLKGCEYLKSLSFDEQNYIQEELIAIVKKEMFNRIDLYEKSFDKKR